MLSCHASTHNGGGATGDFFLLPYVVAGGDMWWVLVCELGLGRKGTPLCVRSE